MEGVAPTLKLLLNFERALECGVSARSAGYRLAQAGGDEIERQLRELLLRFDGGESFATADKISPERRALFELIWRGLHGEPVVAALRDLRVEVEMAAAAELDEFMARLPFKALVPLLALIFPGFMLLLFGPLLRTLMKGIL